MIIGYSQSPNLGLHSITNAHIVPIVQKFPPTAQASELAKEDRGLLGPEARSGTHSELLLSFKDYYSMDKILPNDTVVSLWAYQPRANDEFELERGDMIKVVGLWDDGWATGGATSDIDGARLAGIEDHLAAADRGDINRCGCYHTIEVQALSSE